MRKKLWLTITALFMSFGAMQAAVGTTTGKSDAFDEIVSLVKSRQTEAAYRLALWHEHDGDARISVFLGDCLSYGIGGIKADRDRAFEYYRRAADRVAYAKFRMGIFYAAGIAVPCDKDRACDLMTEAVQAGYKLDFQQSRKAHSLLLTELSDYTDPALKLRFPSSSPKFGLKYLQRYLNRRVLGYSLRYQAADEWFDLYIYDRGYAGVPDGVSEISDKELRDAEASVRYCIKEGMYRNFRDRTGNREGVLPRTGLKYTWFAFCYDTEQAAGLRSAALVFGARGKFFKIRYSGKVEPGVPPEQLPTMPADFLKHLDAALAAPVK